MADESVETSGLKANQKQSTSEGPCGECNEENVMGVVVSIENGPEILFVDLNGYSTIGELLKHDRLYNVDLYYGKWIIEGLKSPIGKISKYEDGVYYITGKYNNNKNKKNNKKKDDIKVNDMIEFDPSKPCVISFLSHHNKYICGDSKRSYRGQVVCNRERLGPWEKFTCVPIKDNIIGLKSHTGKYVCGEPNGNVVHNRDKLGVWEQFEVIKHNDKKGKYSIRSVHFNKYICAKPNGSVVCDRDWCRQWELFKLIVH